MSLKTCTDVVEGVLGGGGGGGGLLLAVLLANFYCEVTEPVVHFCCSRLLSIRTPMFITHSRRILYPAVFCLGSSSPVILRWCKVRSPFLCAIRIDSLP